jgi:hypothetical protein
MLWLIGMTVTVNSFSSFIPRPVDPTAGLFWYMALVACGWCGGGFLYCLGRAIERHN